MPGMSVEYSMERARASLKLAQVARGEDPTPRYVQCRLLHLLLAVAPVRQGLSPANGSPAFVTEDGRLRPPGSMFVVVWAACRHY